MKYVVIYDLKNVRSALSFDSRDDAIDYINNCTDYAGESVNELSAIDSDYYKMILADGTDVNIFIKEHSDSKVRFDLSYDKNGHHVETRRFTKRNLAVNFAHKILNNLDCESDEGEDEFGVWIVNDEDRDLKASLSLNLVILDDKEDSDFDILGIKSTASNTEIKQAYRKMAIKYHPDKGGDSKKFQAIHDAYERIISGKSSSSKRLILSSYDCVDMRSFFKKVNMAVSKAKSDTEAKNYYIVSQLRSKAVGLTFRGFIEAAIGGVLTAASYDAAKSSGATMYTIFSGLIFFGIWDLLRGFYYICNPTALIKKTK